MSAEELASKLLTELNKMPALVAPLSDPEARALVEFLKAEADRHWWINANRSLELAELMIKIGQARGDTWQIALGTMARGDALKLLGRTADAWDALDRAGELFERVGDDVGWARTRIGRLMICVDLNRVPDALADAERAQAIFLARGVPEKRLVLDLNTAIVYGRLSDHRRALALFESALGTAEALGATGQQWLGPLYSNIGLTHEALGDLRQALTFHERARSVWEAAGEVRMVALAETNIAIIAIKQGHYRRALGVLHRARELYTNEELPRDTAEVDRIIVECYLLLSRYADARDLAQQVVGAFHTFGAAYEEAITLLHLAAAEAELANFDPALAALGAAEPIFAGLGAGAWVATTQLRRGQIALQLGDTAAAQREALAAIEGFQRSNQQVDNATAMLLYGQALLASNDATRAVPIGAAALRVAQRNNVPALRYAAHLLLGRIAECRANHTRAIRRYRAAAATVERVQRGLTITLRPGFLENKGEALRALLALQLRHSPPEHAFATLERAKSQVLLSYLANNEQFRWSYDDPRSRALIDELGSLREEHQWYYWLAREASTSEQQHALPGGQQQALAEMAARERRMRSITEQLYLQSGAEAQSHTSFAPPLHGIQAQLDDSALMIEFYNDGKSLWAFTLDAASLQVHQLPTTVGAIDQLLGQLQLNIAAALKAGPAAPVLPQLTAIAQRILQRLHAALLAPLGPALRGRRRLVIVPYGALHFLPFHLLYDGAQYLTERFEIVILPAAALATRRTHARPRGGLALAHSFDGRLPQTLPEARLVHDLFGGALCLDQAAARAALRRPPTQVLHIAAHGEHRLDQPDLSYIQLADGQLYTDDLLQHDLSYELVTLSACETGRANVAGGDELIGLGRGFLYAGAGALIASMWQVADHSTLRLMQHLYHALSAGESKAAGLRSAQLAALHQSTQPHPAFWGPFQLVGDASPLSIAMDLSARKELEDARFTPAY